MLLFTARCQRNKLGSVPQGMARLKQKSEVGENVVVDVAVRVVLVVTLVVLSLAVVVVVLVVVPKTKVSSCLVSVVVVPKRIVSDCLVSLVVVTKGKASDCRISVVVVPKRKASDCLVTIVVVPKRIRASDCLLPVVVVPKRIKASDCLSPVVAVESFAPFAAPNAIAAMTSATSAKVTDEMSKQTRFVGLCMAESAVSPASWSSVGLPAVGSSGAQLGNCLNRSIVSHVELEL